MIALARILKNQGKDDEWAGMTVLELKNELTKYKKKYDKISGGFYCHDCDKFLPADKFYISTKWKSGVVPPCKECLNKIALGYNAKTGKTNMTEESFRKALRIANIPFLRKLYTSSIETYADSTNGISRTSPFQQYMATIQSLPQYKDSTWEDSDMEIGEVEEEKEVKLSKEKKKAALRRFGSGYTDGAYAFLQNEYEDWVARYTIESKAQEELLVEICKVKLKLHDADISGEDTKDLIKSYQDLMASLNVRPDKKDAKSLTESKSFGQLIEMWEEEQPIPEPSEEFKDVDGIMNYLKVWFGWIAKAVGLRNVYTDEYEKIVAQYGVNKNKETEDVASEEIYNSIFGKSE